MKRWQTILRRNKSLRQRVPFFAAAVAYFFSLFSSPAFALESHPGYSRSNRPPSGYWHSDVPGSYNPWIDDIQKTLLKFPATNEAVTSRGQIKILPEGWDMWWYGRVNGPQPSGAWEFIDIGTRNHLLTGTNWVHGPGYQYSPNTWVLQFSDEGSFDSWRKPDYPFVLDRYRGIAIEVSNLGDTYLVFTSDMNKWLGKGHNAVIGLEPGETDILYHPFRRDQSHVPADVAASLGHVHQLCGYPGGHLYESVYSGLTDAEGPWTITATVPPGVKKGDVKWSLNRMWAGGRYKVPSMAEISDPDYGVQDPNSGEVSWTDEYGQWRHDDWVGKIWNRQDVEEQYVTLKQYLNKNPGPSEWNKWGGWEAGPQLEATGWFRVEKYPPEPAAPNEPDNSRWWFVDPAGRLFLSQGALHMGANTPKPAEEAGYSDETFPDEIYFPRLRSMGLNTVGGNSSWKWHTGKMPYTYQIKTGWAPITESDFLNGGAEAFAQHVENLVFSAQGYASDPYCIGFVVDNELSISGGSTLTKDEVEKIYFSTVRGALDELSAAVGRPPMIMFDPASNGGLWMATYCDVLSMHRMDGYTPATWRDKFDSLGTWGIDRPVGQFTFTMGNLDVGVAHYGLTMFLNQRNRGQGVDNYMRRAYSHKNNIAVHMYAYMKTKATPLTEYRFLTNISDTTDYWLAEYVGGIGNGIYYIHMGLEVPSREVPDVPAPPAERVAAGSARFPWPMFLPAITGEAP